MDISNSIAEVLPASTGIRPYVRIARTDHWVKNAFMLLGAFLAVFHSPWLLDAYSLVFTSFAFLATCLVCSGNYVLNEIVDAPFDRRHPVKRSRPVARGEVHVPTAVVLWLALLGAGVALAFRLNPTFGFTALALGAMGVLYNVPPVRTKDVPYLDVLSEAVNNPLRLLLGWFALVPNRIPPLSLILAYWMVGAFFMATKRFAERRRIGDAETAGAYRRSFRHYTEERLLVSMVFYVIAAALFSGIFLVRYRLELILAVPVVTGFLAYYFRLGLVDDSPTQYPERLIRNRRFLVWAGSTTLSLVLLMLVHIPILYALFNVEPSSLPPLWQIGR